MNSLSQFFSSGDSFLKPQHCFFTRRAQITGVIIHVMANQSSWDSFTISSTSLVTLLEVEGRGLVGGVLANCTDQREIEIEIEIDGHVISNNSPGNGSQTIPVTYALLPFISEVHPSESTSPTNNLVYKPFSVTPIRFEQSLIVRARRTSTSNGTLRIAYLED